MARMSAIRERGAKRRDEEVLAAAARVFARRGYADASVQDVADELGILKGSLYHYIDAKEDLLFWLLEAVHAELQSIVDQVAESEGSALERLDLYVRSHVLYNLENLERVSIYYHDGEALGEERLATMTTRRRAHERFVNGLIREAQAEGSADATADPRIFVNCVLATIIGTYRWYKPGGRISRQAIADHCARFVLRGVVGA
jgi:AcrR family transcriptional regulator